MLYVAIDQHSKQLTVNERNEQGDVMLRRQVSTKPDAALKYVQELQKRGEAHGGHAVILEVCGFNDWLIDPHVKTRKHTTGSSSLSPIGPPRT